jgi:LiaI-LiaF-like transmembrane region
MNQDYFIKRLRAPAVLLLLGILALLHTSGIIHSFWHLFWPLLLILLGVLMLAERAALAAEGGYPMWPFSQPLNGAPPSGMGTSVPQNPDLGTSIVPKNSHDFGNGPEGGQS